MSCKHTCREAYSRCHTKEMQHLIDQVHIYKQFYDIYDNEFLSHLQCHFDMTALFGNNILVVERSDT